jgi:NAD(P)-dependent dehydrogenase (short-subunit alcohol dehydrogenase family)
MAKVALVTGAASGIGAATARLLAERGYQVLATDLAQDRLDQAHAGVAGIRTAVLDVRSAADAARVVALAEAWWGGLDALAHVAGVEFDRPVDELPEERWDWVIDTNLKGTYLICAATIPALRRRGGGSIVTTGSVLGRVAIPGVTAYGASKAGVEAITRTMALDAARDGIRVNCVLPGATDTPLMWVSTPPEQIPAVHEQVKREVPLGRMAAPVEIARIIAFLLSDEASYVTGAAFAVDGGILAKSAISA